MPNVPMDSLVFMGQQLRVRTGEWHLPLCSGIIEHLNDCSQLSPFLVRHVMKSQNCSYKYKSVTVELDTGEIIFSG